MDKISKFLHGLLNVFMAGALVIMVVLVFGNVVLRYAFNSGITWSEEMSRYLFVWLTFLGAIGALKEHEHLGVDMLVKRLPVKAKKAVLIISDLLMLGVLVLVLDGSWKMTLINMDSKAPATGLPLSFVYGTGIIVSITMGLIIIMNIYRVMTNKVKEEDLILVKETEESAHTYEHEYGKGEKQA
ncbi:TRAP transporter small permease [Aneurinibacillus sp. UBA3580]|jgi:TRAP-type C4-dicarboxylate transport system permease small subunit|uniref:TRAP transporter small permease n=1 Tax=Aneurinibacillus sp. UBA3580 TaxID=1946041 RepID=UPI0025810B3E|nr:TRAP transporter small permease [Aneurinibacillus sp. UBA3580]